MFACRSVDTRQLAYSYERILGESRWPETVAKKRKTTKATANYAADTSAEAENTNPLKPKKKVSKANLFKLRKAAPKTDLVHKLKGVARCDTEPRGYETPQNKSLTELVVHVSEGVIPLWAPNSILRWRFQRSLVAIL